MGDAGHLGILLRIAWNELSAGQRRWARPLHRSGGALVCRARPVVVVPPSSPGVVGDGDGHNMAARPRSDCHGAS